MFSSWCWCCRTVQSCMPFLKDPSFCIDCRMHWSCWVTDELVGAVRGPRLWRSVTLTRMSTACRRYRVDVPIPAAATEHLRCGCGCWLSTQLRGQPNPLSEAKVSLLTRILCCVLRTHSYNVLFSCQLKVTFRWPACFMHLSCVAQARIWLCCTAASAWPS